MASTFLNGVKAHLPIIIDFVGLATGITLIVYASQTFVPDRCSPGFAVVFASLVLGHFLVPIPRRTPLLYGTLLVIGIVSTVFYALDTVHGECGYQVIIGRPRDLDVPKPPKHGEGPYPADLCLRCTDVAGAWWLNLILTLYVDFVFAVALIQRNSHGRIRLPEAEAEAGATTA